MKKIIVAASGASGVFIADKILTSLPQEVQKHFIKTQNSTTVAMNEHSNLIIHENSDIAASIASGSYQADAMIVAPCSMNTLAKIACGIADNLVTRAAAVMIKEQKKLLLAPREMPFSAIALENMLKLSRLGVIIAPPILGYYSNQHTLDQMEDFVIGKWFDLLGIDNTLYKRWEGESKI